MRVVHMLNWNLNDIKNNLGRIKDQGFDTIQINPIQPLKEESTENWWMSYQPISFEIGNIYGSKKDLYDLCYEASKYGITIVADVICNHMAGNNNGSLYPAQNVDYKLRENPYFWKEASQITDWKDRKQVISKCMGLPGLQTSNYDLQNIIIKFLNELIDTGVNGFRFDAAKNIALTNEGCDFWPRVIYCLKKYNLILYGELIFASDLIDEYTKYLKVVTNNDYHDKDKIIRYAESHDSFYDLSYTRQFSDLEIAYQYRDLCGCYPNTLFFTRPYSDAWKDSSVRQGNYQRIKK